MRSHPALYRNEELCVCVNWTKFSWVFLSPENSISFQTLFHPPLPVCGHSLHKYTVKTKGVSNVVTRFESTCLGRWNLLLRAALKAADVHVSFCVQVVAESATACLPSSDDSRSLVKFKTCYIGTRV